jgi:hypothetical protein
MFVREIEAGRGITAGSRAIDVKVLGFFHIEDARDRNHRVAVVSQFENSALLVICQG